MRPKDIKKYEAIVTSSIELVTKIGFSNISMHKIAQQSNISPGTIYIHFKNKNDLFEKIYDKIREEASDGSLEGIRDIPEDNIEQLFKTTWKNSLQYYLDHPNYIDYREKFEQTPLMDKMSTKVYEIEIFLKKMLNKGIKNRIIKNLPIPMLISFSYTPIVTLLRMHVKGTYTLDDQQILEACNLAWRVIEL